MPKPMATALTKFWMGNTSESAVDVYKRQVHEITIIPRGQAGGYTMYLPEKDRSYVTKGEMRCV